MRSGSEESLHFPLVYHIMVDVEESIYIAEKLVNHRIDEEDGKDYYYVKWKGYERVEDLTWEPLENLTNCQCLIDEYWSKVKIRMAQRNEFQKAKLKTKNDVRDFCRIRHPYDVKKPPINETLEIDEFTEWAEQLIDRTKDLTDSELFPTFLHQNQTNDTTYFNLGQQPKQTRDNRDFDSFRSKQEEIDIDTLPKFYVEDIKSIKGKDVVVIKNENGKTETVDLDDFQYMFPTEIIDFFEEKAFSKMC